jgi:hypothetical protein
MASESPLSHNLWQKPPSHNMLWSRREVTVADPTRSDILTVRSAVRFFSGVPHPHLLGVCCLSLARWCGCGIRVTSLFYLRKGVAHSAQIRTWGDTELGDPVGD